MADERLMSDLREAESKVSRANHELAEALESAKSHAQRAAQADAAKTEFVGILAHEIRNPLAVIISMAEALCDAGLSTEQQEYSESVHRSAERLLALTEDALDLSRIERGRLTIQADPFDLQSVLEEVGALFARSAKEKAILLAIEYPVSAPRRFVGDSGRIRQVVVNLVTNSLKFTSSGHVRISAACEDGGHECVPVRVAVADSGMGIPPERLGSLFEMFSSSCDGAAGPRKGSGLGLTICKRLVEQMGGDIHVESEPGKGSRFWFELRLPVVRQSSAPVGG
jgi:signal transduction histidine kinase